MFTTAKSLMTLGSGLAHWAMDVCFPPRCPSCDVSVEATGNLCRQCYSGLMHISEPLCICCGVPFAVDMEDALCAQCLETPPLYDTARAVWGYNEISSVLVTRLKFHDHSTLLPRYGALLAGAGKKTLAQADLIVPVPLHWRRLLMRRYNQSALLAYALSRQTRIPIAPHALRRIRATKPQTTLKGDARQRNVRHAFSARASLVEAKRVVLVDDVMTTGATITACTDALKQAGALEVHVLTLARTVKT